MGGMFLGGAVGSAGAAAAWAFGGWPAVSVFGGGLGLLAVAVQLAGTTRRRASAVALEKSL